MKIDLTSSNPALESIFSNPSQVITLDVNFLIPPDRSRHTRKSFDFQKFKSIWIDPIFDAFPNLAIHESVYDELLLAKHEKNTNPEWGEFIEAMETIYPLGLIQE